MRARHRKRGPKTHASGIENNPDPYDIFKRGGRVQHGEGHKSKERHDRPARRAKGGGNWIGKAVQHHGALHQALGVPAGHKIPLKKLAKAAKSTSPTMRKRANLAKTLGKMSHS